ncbi:MAG TPA: biotin--[acetyl-CoA-carboxylase] ligase [Vicinamibacterales bacterium]|nr:biotin--[acetyl-CoA-carboxylase] ligase [Vicinamibacterales bacterium]
MLEAEPLPSALAAAIAHERDRLAVHASEVRYVRVVPSTMDAAAALAEAGAPHGLVLVAGQQTAGRGRRGQTWVSPEGAGLYFSIVVRPKVAPMQDGVPSVLGLLTLGAGLAVAEGVGHATGLEASLKWPNDLFYGFKLAGVLAEGHGIGTPGQFVVVGVGINLRDVEYLTDAQGRATSIEKETGQAPDAGVVLASVLAAWAQRYQDLLDGKYARVVDRWRVRASGLVGRPVAWVDAAGEHEGTTTGVDTAGALLVDTGEGIVRITSGAVTWQ